MVTTCCSLLEVWGLKTLPCGSWEHPLAHWAAWGNRAWVRAETASWCLNAPECPKPFVALLNHPSIFMSESFSDFLKWRLIRAIKDSFPTVNTCKGLQATLKMQLLLLSVFNYLLCAVCCESCAGYMNNSLFCVSTSQKTFYLFYSVQL